MIEGDKAGWIRQKESVYRKLYSALLRKHQGALQASIQEHTPSGQNNDNSYLIMTVNSHDFHHEDEIMNTILRTEVQNLLIGVGATALGFATLRFGSRYAFSLGLFGTTKAKAMQEAEQQAKRRGTDTFQKSFAFFVEGMFSLWFGFRCYDYASHHYSDTSWEAIADLPLVEGRSRVSEALCPDWIRTTNEQIPIEFWKALEQKQLNDERTWKVIRQFSTNCEKRLAVEHRIRMESSIVEHEHVILKERIHANNDYQSNNDDANLLLTEEIVKNLVSDD